MMGLFASTATFFLHRNVKRVDAKQSGTKKNGCNRKQPPAHGRISKNWDDARR